MNTTFIEHLKAYEGMCVGQYKMTLENGGAFWYKLGSIGERCLGFSPSQFVYDDDTSGIFVGITQRFETFPSKKHTAFGVIPFDHNTEGFDEEDFRNLLSDYFDLAEERCKLIDFGA